ncbi:hypothetical protein Tco_0522827 [Tanacetum coccineum]
MERTVGLLKHSKASSFIKPPITQAPATWEENSDKGWLGKIVFKPDGSQDKESIHMMDIYDDRFKDVCEPENDESSSPTSTIVEEFESLLGRNIKKRKEDGDIIFLEKLLENENFFEMNDKKVEFLERKTKEDFETKDEPKKKKELQVFHPDIETFNHFETTSMSENGKIFDPGITFHEKSFENDTFKDKSSKELAPSKALLTLDVFDPLHPPLMDFHCLSGFWKIHGSKLWKDKAMPTISIDDLQSSLHKMGNLLSLAKLSTNPIALDLKCEEQDWM